MNNNVKISITGKNPTYFIKRYIINKINYINLEKVNYDKVYIIISYNDYLKLKEIKSIYDIEIVKFYGINKFLFLLKNNYTFLLAGIISFIFLIIISNIIFEINIVHNDKKIRTLVRNNLTENKIEKLKFVPSFRKRKNIIDKILANNKNDLEWLEIERKGSKLIVKVTEKRINDNTPSLEPRHIVAKKNGIITKVEASNGVIIKNKNDYVSKGDIIISGDIIKDETVKGQVKAEGVVYAETWYKVSITYPLKYNEIIYLDDVKNNIIIKFIDKEFSLRKNYSKMYLEKKNVLINNKLIPFSVSIERQRKTKIISKKYSKDQALKHVIKLAEEKIKGKLDTDECILDEKILNLSSFDSRIEVDVFFKVNENITDYADVDKSLIEEENEE